LKVNRGPEAKSIKDYYGGAMIPPWVTGVGDTKSQPLAALYRRIGKRQKVAGLAFVVVSILSLVLSVVFESVVLQIDSVVAFAVAAILFLKENRNRVQSRVLNAVVSSLGGTIAELSSVTGSTFTYVSFGKSVSDVAIVGSPETNGDERTGGLFKIVPPGIGLAELFGREAEGIAITEDSLKYLLPSIINENFGLAESVEVTSKDSNIEVLLRKPNLFCSCQNNETRRSGVVGCTVSSFLAVLYCFGTQKAVLLDRCVTDMESGTWRIAISLQAKAV